MTIWKKEQRHADLQGAIQNLEKSIYAGFCFAGEIVL
jgi:hypothetical protein